MKSLYVFLMILIMLSSCRGMQKPMRDVIKEPADLATPETRPENETTEEVLPEVTFDNVLNLKPGEKYRLRPSRMAEGKQDNFSDWRIHYFWWGNVDEGPGRLLKDYTPDDPKVSVFFELNPQPYSETLDGKRVFERLPDGDFVFDEIVIQITKKVREGEKTAGTRDNKFTYSFAVYDVVVIKNLTHPDRTFEYE